MTENRYGNVYFDGVCADTSNAAYPVDRVSAAVEPVFEPPWDEPAVHLALTLIHRGYVVEAGDGFALSDEATELTEDELVASVCADLRPRLEGDGDEDEAAAFVGFVRDVLGSLTEEV